MSFVIYLRPRWLPYTLPHSCSIPSRLFGVCVIQIRMNQIYFCGDRPNMGKQNFLLILMVFSGVFESNLGPGMFWCLFRILFAITRSLQFTFCDESGRNTTFKQAKNEHLEPGQKSKNARIFSESSGNTGQPQGSRRKPPNPVIGFKNPNSRTPFVSRRT